MLRRVHSPRGLNLRQSDINRPPENAQDLRNVEKNSKGELILRWGIEWILDDADIIDLFEYVGAQDDPNRGALLVLKSDGLYRLEGSTIADLPEGNVNGQPTWTDQTRPVEYNKVLYWNDPALEADLWKFDGYATYRAGVPKPAINSVSYAGTAGTYYFRVILKFYDCQGNATYSDYEQYTGTAQHIILDLPNVLDPNYGGFYQKHCEFGGGAGFNQLINSGNLTATGITSHNYVAGDYALIGLRAIEAARPVKIDSVTATTITFDAASVGTDDFDTINDLVFGGLERRYEILVYRSTLPLSNYVRVFDGTSTPSPHFRLNNNVGGVVLTTNSVGLDESLNSVYDDTLIRVLPPKGKYLALFNEQMVVGNLGREQEDFGYASLLSNDSRLEDSIAWSDIATLNNGSSVETFLVNNIRSIGASEDGAISGVFGNDDSLVVHKEKQSYYVNGSFVDNTLRVRKAMTENVGSASHRSIRQVDGGHLYVTPKGVFLAIGGQKPIELSDVIEPLFTDNALSLPTLELDKAKSVTDFLREKIYIYIPATGDTGYVIVYDYYYKEWFLHDNIPGDKGFQDVGISSTEIYMADSGALYKRNLNIQTDSIGTTNPTASKVIGYYWTGWFDLDAPTLAKKFINFIMMSISSNSFVATIKSYCNWDKTTAVGENTITFDSSINVEDSQVLQGSANSASFRISNESDGSNLLITGYEVEVEPNQQSPKGDT